jgi:hypothetical protein
MVDADFTADALARIARCLHYWDTQGYRFVSLPWLTPARYTDATKPAAIVGADVATAHGNLVASGEQSFLMLCEQGLLPAGDRFIGWTPCFRQEPVFDSRHHFYFMKAELFLRVPNRAAGREALAVMVAGAEHWMQQEVRNSGVTSRLWREDLGPDQTDLLLGTLELGSYGVREFAGQYYVYGTACAEPRLSEAISRCRQPA